MSPSDLADIHKELNALRKQQDELMAVAIYIGMSKEQAKLSDMRQHHIIELYEELLRATQYRTPENASSDN